MSNYVDAGYVRSGYIRLDGDTIEGLTFDGYGKLVFVSPSIPSINVDDVYRVWLIWAASALDLDNNSKWLGAMRYSGYDPIPGGFTGATYFMRNGWRLVFSPKNTAVSGVLFSEDFQTAYYDYNLDPVFPVAVSAVVNNVTTTQNVITGVALTPEQTASAVWSKVIEGALTAEMVQRILLAVAAGPATGLEGVNPTFKSQDGTKDRVVGTYDAGDRTTESVDGSP